jgi:hypothetical protein
MALLNTTATTVNAFGAATAINIGTTTGFTKVSGDMQVGTSSSTNNQAANLVIQGDSNQSACFIQGNSAWSASTNIIFSANRYGIPGGFQLYGDHTFTFGAGGLSLGAQVGIATESASRIGLIIKGASSQTAHLLDINSNAGSGGDIMAVLTTGVTVGGTLAVTGASTFTGIATTNGRIRALAVKTTTYTILTSDDVIVGNHATVAFTITLPTLASSAKSQFTIKNKGAAAVTLDGDGAETIDGAANVVLNQYESVTVINDTTQWLII